MILVLSIDTNFKTFRFTLLERRAIKIDPTAPSAADSVGVAIPDNIDPKTIKIKINGVVIGFMILKKL